MITVPLVFRRFFGSIKDGFEVNDLLDFLSEIASRAAVSRSNSADTESLAGLLLTSPPFDFRMPAGSGGTGKTTPTKRSGEG
jgi:hypothetical protein